MSLSERERFIQHYITITTLRTLVDRIKMGDLTVQHLMSMSMENNKNLGKRDVDIIWKNRCRSLSKEDLDDIFESLAEEALIGGSAINDMLM
tara:strand:+ start:3370 stop:3645 length:276 start_codon:yes stop_codon:yes gene_type:complete